MAKSVRAANSASTTSPAGGEGEGGGGDGEGGGGEGGGGLGDGGGGEGGGGGDEGGSMGGMGGVAGGAVPCGLHMKLWLPWCSGGSRGPVPS